MEQKIIFIDIDGTLVTHINGCAYIPESAKNAIRQTRKNGHLVYLCTGRSKAEIDQTIMDIGFDGLIGAAGGYIETDGKVLFHRCFEKKDLKQLEFYFNQYHIGYYLESNDGLYCDKIFYHFLKDVIHHGSIPEEDSFCQLLRPIQECTYEGVNKLSFYTPQLPYTELLAQFSKQYDLVQSSWLDGLEGTGEISLKGINKAFAIQLLIQYLAKDLEDTIGIGDSMNDLEMFQCVGTAIAMGNSLHGVQREADFVTKDVLADGLAYALHYYDLY